jgi:hypothetical protein
LIAHGLLPLSAPRCFEDLMDDFLGLPYGGWNWMAIPQEVWNHLPNVFFKQMGRPPGGRCGNFERFRPICAAQREPRLSHLKPH